MSSQLSKLLDEQTTLRTQMEDLFAQRAAINLQMKEIEDRLHWLDGEIDRVEESEMAEVKPEPLHQPQASRFTQHPDEFLTDPTSDDIEDMMEATDNARRISESPTFNSFQGNVNEQNQNQAASRQSSQYATNPFGDLWSAKDRNQFEHDGVSASMNIKTAAAKSNTLERYFVQSKPAIPAHAPSSMSMQQNHESIMPKTNSNVQNNNNRTNSPANQQYPWTQRLYYHLQHTFRIPSFRDHQLSIINGTLSHRDIFVIMRTGGGKSLTYQLPAILEMESSQKVTVVISPLLSLIRDQEEQMNRMYPGSATSFTSGMGREEHTSRWNRVRDANGGVALVFVTPEKVGKSGRFKGEMEKLFGAGRLGRFVIDEAHCATQWGHDFRPDYTKLGILKRHFPSIPVLAVTATASDKVRQDCCDILRLDRNHLFFRSSANRPNLTYIVKTKADSKDAVIKDMVAFIKDNHETEAGIIYTFSKKEADEVADALCANGIVARSYHSDVSDSRKNIVHRSWMRNETQVVVATIAFGLGINKPDVRFVLHHSLSKSLEAYYQESGRAGRDGQPGNCVLYYTPKDVPRMLGMIHGERVESSFWGMVRYAQAHGDDQLCRHQILVTLGEVDVRSQSGKQRQNEIADQCITTERRDVGAHAQTVTRVVNVLGDTATLNQIVTKWRSKTDDRNFSFLKDNPPAKDLTKEECERTIVSLLIEDILHPNIVFNSYSTICYLRLGPLGQNMLTSTNPHFTVAFPIRQARAKAIGKMTPKAALAVTDDDGWISPKDNKTQSSIAKKNKNSSTKTKRTGRKLSAKIAKKPKRSTTASKKAAVKTVFEIDSSSSESSDEEIIKARRNAAKRKRRSVIDDDSSIEESI